MEQFLEKNKGSTQMGCIISLDEKQGISVEEKLLGSGFSRVDSPKKFVDEIKIANQLYIPLYRLEEQSSFYDVIFGYASGQVHYEDTWTTPNYSNLNCVAVVTLSFLEDEQEAGRDWQSLFGITYNLI
jgi:hypothetical protein